AGGTVWFDPELWVGYRPRGSWATLARQYHEYGWWKAEVLRRHPDSLRLRQAAPAALPVVLAASLLGARSRPTFLVVPVVYTAALLAAARSIAPASRARGVLVLAVSHMAWGTGFWRGSTSIRRQRPT
ncbi:MAG: hypothetical protein RLZZ01_34, partial [Actinomycetota bacterium]